MQNDDRPDRITLDHGIPHWVEEGALFFVTVNCSDRGRDQLTSQRVSDGLLESVRFYHEQRKWHVTLWLLMPDHLHALLSFPPRLRMNEVLKSWKRFTARQFGIEWQDGFFDHRLRNAAEEQAKHHYIRHNPVRKGLCVYPEEWPHQLRWSQQGWRAGG